MELKLQRFLFGKKDTIGKLYIDDVYFCYTLEDVVRGPGIKIPGETAIPAGLYSVIIDLSTRFKRLMPHILNVPDFEGIRIHKGNTDADTEGCILLGKTWDKSHEDFIGQSKIAFDEFFALLEVGVAKGKVTISIE